MMRVCVGSTSPSKIEAAKLGFSRFFDLVDVFSADVSSGVADQPVGFDAMMKGAQNRARAAFKDCTYSVGIEAGFHLIDDVAFNGALVAVYDGKTFHFGTGPWFELPISIVDDIILKKTEVGHYIDSLMGAHESKKKTGVIALLTQNKVTRSEINSYAVMMAIVPFINTRLYEKS